MADAKLVIVNGLGYDDFMQKLLGASPNPDRVVIDVETLLGLPADVNVHVWYDPATMPKVAAAATNALTKLEPANAAYFAANEQAYLGALKPIGDKIAQLKATYAGAPIAFTENVAGYLTDQIGLLVKTPIGFMKAVEEGTDPAPADVAAERDLFTTKAVKVLLYNSQVTSPTTQEIHDLAAQNGIPIVGVAETIPPQFQTYQEWQLAELAELDAGARQGAVTAMTDPLVRFDERDPRLPRAADLVGPVARVRARLVHRHPRPERVGQDLAAAGHPRPDRPLGGQRRGPRGASAAWEPGDRLRAPAPQLRPRPAAAGPGPRRPRSGRASLGVRPALIACQAPRGGRDRGGGGHVVRRRRDRAPLGRRAAAPADRPGAGGRSAPAAVRRAAREPRPAPPAGDHRR